MDFASSTRVAEDRTRWKGTAATSSVVPDNNIEYNKNRLFILGTTTEIVLGVLNFRIYT